MTRDEIRRKALRSAAAVAFSVSLLNCGGAVTWESAEGETDEGQDDPAPVATVDPPPTIDVPMAPAPTASTQPTIGFAPCIMGDTPETQEEFAACCEESNWMAPGCIAWGPPVPPAFAKSERGFA